MARRPTTKLIGWALTAAVLAVGCQPQAKQQSRIPVPEAPPCSNQNLSTEALFSDAKQGVAVVKTDGGEGSAFVVRHQDGNTLLLTNSHVVDGSRSATVKWADGGQDAAAVLSDAGGRSPQADLALLEVKGLRGKPLDLKAAKPNVGADIVAIGAPKGLEFSLTRGVVSSLRDDGEILQIDAPINPGNSGGPVLDRTGCVVGVATFKLTDSEGLNFAVASSVIEGFLTNPVARSAPPSNPPPETPFNPSNPGTGIASGATCWFQMQRDAERLEGFRCAVTSRKNANGHTVFDVVEPGGLTRTVVLWEDKSAEVLLDGSRYEAQWAEDDDGDIRVRLEGGVFAFRYRG
jgi:serine protease Do